MKKTRNLFLFSTLLTVILSLFTGCNPFILPSETNQYPSDYDYIEWVSITEDEARELFKNYSHEKLHEKAVLYTQLTYGDTALMKNCTVKGNSYFEYFLEEITYSIPHLTVNPDDWNSLEYTPLFYKSKTDSNIVKISHTEGIIEDYSIYENGWLKEHVSITNGPKNHGYSKEFVMYK